MNVVDTSGWIEYFGDGRNADAFAPAVEDVDALIVPTIVIYETYKRFLQLRDEAAAMEAVLAMHAGHVIELDFALAVEAARLSASLHLPMADSIILATARAYGAIVWTQDAHFQALPDARVIAG